VSGDTDEWTTYIGRAQVPTVVTSTTTRSWDLDDDGRPMVLVPVPGRPRSVTRLIWIAVAVVALFCVIGAATVVLTRSLLTRPQASPASPPASASAATPPAARPAPSPKPSGLNTPVRDGMFQFTVTAISCGHDTVSASVFHRTAHGQFCLVTLTVSNVGHSGRAFAEGFQKAIAADAGTYTPDVAAGLIVNGSGAAVFSTLDPGNSVSGTLVYDIPRTASIARLELHDSPFSDGVSVTL
jgi:hypothetical protein